VADVVQDKWMKAMTVTVTAMAVIASIGLSRSTFYISKAQFLTAQEEDQWAYFQAKTIKQDIFITQEKSFQVDLLGATTPAQKSLLDKTINDSSNDIARYDKEKADIKS